MNTYLVKLDKLTDIDLFIKVMSTIPYEANLTHGKHCCSARSLMGIFSLNLSEPLTLEISTPEKMTAEEEATYADVIAKVSYLFINKTSKALMYDEILERLKDVIDKGKLDNDNGEYADFIKELKDIVDKCKLDNDRGGHDEFVRDIKAAIK